MERRRFLGIERLSRSSGSVWIVGREAWPKTEALFRVFPIACPINHPREIIGREGQKKNRMDNTIRKNHLNKEQFGKLFHCQKGR